MDSALLEIFSKETASHLETLRQYVASCSDKEAPFSLNEDVRRAVHTLHGSANMASVAEIVAIAEPLDHYVSECFNAGQRIPRAALEVLRDATAIIEAQVACINQQAELPETGRLAESGRRPATGGRRTGSAHRRTGSRRIRGAGH